MALIWIITCVVLLGNVLPVRPDCDLEKAEVCVKEMEDVITDVLETAAGIGRTGRLQHLCLDVIKGNNLTQCFINATSGCSESTETGPNSTVQNWERVMHDLYRLCDGACPEFLQRTVNITQCTAIIRFDALYQSSYQLFCSSLNESLQCVNDVSASCPEFGQLFFDLLPDGIEDTATAICTGGCDRFDESLAHLETCKNYIMDMPGDLDKACASYEQFKTCIRLSEAPVACPMFASLMEVLYPQHIFGMYEENCRHNNTRGDVQPTDESDVCGEVGEARINHCIGVFALSWPAEEREDRPTKEQCRYFRTGTECLENSGFNECGNLREYFQETLGRRRELQDGMLDRCNGIGVEPGSGSVKPSAWIMESPITYLLLFSLSLNRIMSPFIFN